MIYEKIKKSKNSEKKQNKIPQIKNLEK